MRNKITAYSLFFVPNFKAAKHSLNPRTPLGATQTTLKVCAHMYVSIHAPVWVRLDELAKALGNDPFQSTHPFGCDRCGRCVRN